LSSQLGQRPNNLPPGAPIKLNPHNETDLQWHNMTVIRHPIGKGPFDPTKYAGYALDNSVNNPLVSMHAAGVHVLMVDGSVRFVAENINFDTLKYLATRDDRQSVGEF
jgi:prepilin-type processing-associated H-X9-DG protein